MSPAKPSHTAVPPSRHPEYYLFGGDVIFLAGNFLFRAHRHFFERESKIFAQFLSAATPGGLVPRGQSESTPFVLQASAEDFANFLWVFYNPKFSVYKADIPKWVSILSFAVEWGFAEVKALAVRHLEDIEMADISRIILYTKYEVDKALLEPALLALIRRKEPLTVNEGTELSLNLLPKTLWGLVRLREMARWAEKQDETGKSPVAPHVTMSDTEATKLVRNLMTLNDDKAATNNEASKALANDAPSVTTIKSPPPSRNVNGSNNGANSKKVASKQNGSDTTLQR